MSVGTEYLRVIQERFSVLKEQGEKTFVQLSDQQLQWSMNDTQNSIAILIQHLSGNMLSRWTDFLTTDGEKSSRNRDFEFVESGLSKTELMEQWELGWSTFFNTLQEMKETDLLKKVYIRGQEHSALDAIERQMAHYAAHIGQIMFIGKLIKDKQWESLSIPKGESAAYLERMLKEHK